MSRKRSEVGQKVESALAAVRAWTEANPVRRRQMPPEPQPWVPPERTAEEWRALETERRDKARDLTKRGRREAAETWDAWADDAAANFVALQGMANSQDKSG